jgi:integrase
MYRERFTAMQANGRDVWTQADEDAVREWIDLRKRNVAGLWELHKRDMERVQYQGQEFAAVLGNQRAAVQSPSQPEEKQTGKTLYDAMDAFLDALKAKRKSESHRWRMEQIIKINLKRVREDCPMSAIDFAWLDALADYYKGRPLSNKGKKKNRKPISPQTVKTTLSHLRQFFIWCDDVSFGGWQAPRKLTKPFRVRLDDLRTRSELREVGRIEQFELPTLVKLYKTGSEFQQAIMLTALFTGGTQQELAVLQKDEFDLDKAQLHHHRNKTNVEGRFWLPPELVTLLRSQFGDHRRQPLSPCAIEKWPRA